MQQRPISVNKAVDHTNTNHPAYDLTPLGKTLTIVAKVLIPSPG